MPLNGRDLRLYRFLLLFVGAVYLLWWVAVRGILPQAPIRCLDAPGLAYQRLIASSAGLRASLCKGTAALAPFTRALMPLLTPPAVPRGCVLTLPEHGAVTALRVGERALHLTSLNAYDCREGADFYAEGRDQMVVVCPKTCAALGSDAIEVSYRCR